MSEGLFVTSVELGIRNVHLISGEDIIGKVHRLITERVLRIENPVMPSVGLDPATNNYKVGLLPLRPYLDKIPHVDIPEENVLYHTEVGQRMVQLYTQFNSNIVVAGPGTLNQILNGK